MGIQSDSLKTSSRLLNIIRNWTYMCSLTLWVWVGLYVIVLARWKIVWRVKSCMHVMQTSTCASRLCTTYQKCAMRARTCTDAGSHVGGGITLNEECHLMDPSGGGSKDANHKRKSFRPFAIIIEVETEILYPLSHTFTKLICIHTHPVPLEVTPRNISVSDSVEPFLSNYHN